jgi:hypothetical protein
MVAPETPGTSEEPDAPGTTDVKADSTDDKAITLQQSVTPVQNMTESSVILAQNVVEGSEPQVQNMTESPVIPAQNVVEESEAQMQNMTESPVIPAQNVVEETAEVTQNNVEAVGPSTKNVTEEFASASETKSANELTSNMPVFQDAQIPEQKIEIDPEAGTTVLTAGMSGPLTAEMNATNSFAGSENYDKVVTPAPVTTSAILSNESVPPVTPTVQAYQYNGTGVNYGAPSVNRNINNSYPVNNYSNNDLITPWGYVGYSLLFAIPILGLVMLFVYGFGEGHSPNLRNYARGNLLMILLVFGIEIVLMIFMAILGVSVFSIFG